MTKKHFIPMTDDMHQIFKLVEAERQRQDTKWGGSDHDDTHSMNQWGLIIEGICHKIEKAETIADAERELVQAAATAFAALESIKRAERGLGSYQLAFLRQFPLSLKDRIVFTEPAKQYGKSEAMRTLWPEDFRSGSVWFDCRTYPLWSGCDISERFFDEAEPEKQEDTTTAHTCKSCKEPVKDTTDRFCRTCGGDLRQCHQECNNCGHTAIGLADDPYCPKCGKPTSFFNKEDEL
ncbi:MAG: hypothetical protein AB7E76_02725 [Deferribacterales bacterium]